MSDSDLEKTEEATPEKRRKAREEGQFARSKDAGATAGSLAALGCLVGLGAHLAQSLRVFAVRCFSEPAELQSGAAAGVFEDTLLTLAKLVVPVAGAAAVASAAVGFAEAGFHPNLGLVTPRWDRLEPLSKLKNLFSPKSASVNLLLSLARVLAVAGVAYWVIQDTLPTLTRLSRSNLLASTRGALDVAVSLALWTSLCFVVIAVADYAYAWYKHQREIRMTRQELKDEFKQQEGRPEMKAKRRARARELVQRALADQVPKSDVIVVNPTHVSVALRYRAGEGAPVVLAKGYDDIALHIRELAKKHDIPIIENVTLARALAAQVRPGKTIPSELYQAVAEVLAFVYRLRRQAFRA